MIAHHVLFWLKADTTDEQKQAFRNGLQSLENIEVIKNLHIGTPVLSIDRPVVDTTYTFSLVVFFDDLAGHDVYQVHPVHKAFLEEFRVMFEKVIIYDAA
ncbi:Dabb family protein [Mucilaginibacter agri]|uniref:Dabb family protein n=1 Tax=Mucilaginibacter agri TaxID=2695265 RepID=A0A965ZET2_9SPHI|nr:Dabb family protein [Mucilaginibacter agri]NCD68669.1 Dabb family protein [Mucilaginibacter agri]